jgi:hypothetical protein
LAVGSLLVVLLDTAWESVVAIYGVNSMGSVPCVAFAKYFFTRYSVSSLHYSVSSLHDFCLQLW